MAYNKERAIREENDATTLFINLILLTVEQVSRPDIQRSEDTF